MKHSSFFILAQSNNHTINSSSHHHQKMHGLIQASILLFLFTFLRGQVWTVQSVLTASNLMANDNFGHAVSLTYNYALVGAWLADLESFPNAGAAYIFARSGTTWTQQAILTANNKASGDNFGHAVALSDSHALIGAWQADPDAITGAGAAYIFSRAGDVWKEQSYLTAQGKNANDNFGFSVALSDNYALVGTINGDPMSIFNAGTAYIYTVSGTSWLLQKTLTASKMDVSDNFGSSVAITDNYALVGARGVNAGNVVDTGAAYLFTRSGDSWTESFILTASNKIAQDWFGQSVSLTDNLAVVGLSGPTRTYSFARSGADWIEETILSVSASGRVIDMTDNYLIVRNNVYTRTGGNWVLEYVLSTTLYSVGITDDYILTGNHLSDPGGIVDAGEATVFQYEVSRSRSVSKSLSQSFSLETQSQSVSRSHSFLTKSRILTQSRPQSTSKSESEAPNQETLAASPEEVDTNSMIYIIIGAVGAGLFVMIVLLCIRRKAKDRRNRKEAANIFDSQFIGRHEEVDERILETYKRASAASPQIFDSVFASRNPNTGAPKAFANMENTGTLLGHGHPDKPEGRPSSLSTVTEFGMYSDIANVSFSQLVLIGSGAFGYVYRVELAKGIVAAKIPKDDIDIGSKEYNSMLEEAKIMSRLRHVNITQLLGYGTHPTGVLVFLMELAECCLSDMLRGQPLDLSKVVEFGHGIVKGLCHLHMQTPPITHRDLKPENVLLVKGVVKLADFGLATACEIVTRTTGFAGTPAWSPPESFSRKFPGPPGDIYACGLLLWSMVTGKIPYQGFNFNQILAAKYKNQVPSIPFSCPSALSKVMKQCWKLEPHERPTASRLDFLFEDLTKS